MRFMRKLCVLGGVLAVAAAGVVPGVAAAAPAVPSAPYSVLTINHGGDATTLDPSNAVFTLHYYPAATGRGEAIELDVLTNGLTDTVRFFAREGGPGLSANTTYTDSSIGWFDMSEQSGDSCGDPGPFTIYDLTRDATGAVVGFGASYKQPYCYNGRTGEIRYNSPKSYAAQATTITGGANWRNVLIGTTSSVLTFTVTSRGVDPVTVSASGLTVGGVFTVVSDTCTAGLVLSYGQSCSVGVVAKPTQAGDVSTGVTVTDSLGRLAAGIRAQGTLDVIGNLIPFTAIRLLDTRSGNGAPRHPLGAAQTMVLQVLGRTDVGSPGLIPATGVSAVVLNLTVTNATSASFVTAFPDGTARPDASSINFAQGWTGANSVTVKVGANGMIDLYNLAGTVDLIADIDGYYLDDESQAVNLGVAGQYHPTTPVRVLDTRTAGHGQVAAGSYVTVPLSGLGADLSHVRAVAANVTAVNPHSSGFLTASNSGPDSEASTLNFTTGATVANFAIVAIDTFRGVFTVTNTAAAGVDVVVDVFGYYDDNTFAGGLRFHPTSPTRIVDSRSGMGVPGALTGNSITPVTTPGSIIGPNTKALALNVTGVNPNGPTFMNVWATGTPQPSTSNLNLTTGDIRSNAAITGISTGGQFDVYNQSGTVNLVIDVAGTFQ